MNHLNEEQIAELVSASPRQLREATQDSGQEPGLAAIEAHLAECAQCAAEVASLRESLAFFREASSAYAEAQLDRMPVFRRPLPRPLLRQPIYWAAAAALFLAAAIPLQMSFHHNAKTPTPTPAPVIAQHEAAPSESDEALLQDVSQQLSRSVPTSMEALADPTGSAVIGTPNATQRTN